MGWGSTRNKSGTAAACPSTSISERALLEGYRMGLQTRGANKSAHHERGANGKGSGKGGGKNGKSDGGKGSATREDRTCQREGCRAAERGQATWGGACNCHVCGLSLTATLPVEQLCARAYEQRLSEAKDTAAKNKGVTAPQAKAAAKSKAAPRNAAEALTDEQLADRRTERLAELKGAKTPPKDDDQATALQEVAKVFLDDRKEMRRMEVDKELVESACGLDKKAKGIIDSLKAEALPSERPLQSPAEVLQSLLARSSEVKADIGKDRAQETLDTTRAGLAALRAGGVTDDDEVVRLMISREKKQLAELTRLGEKAPSQEMRKETMASIRQNFVKQLQAQADFRSNRAEKAEERAAARTSLAQELMSTARALLDAASAAKSRLCLEHAGRAEHKREQGAKVLELIDERVVELDAQDVDFTDAGQEDMTTPTEDDRDEAQRLSSLLEKQLLQLRGAATQSDAVIAEQAAALAKAETVWDATEDLWLEFDAKPELVPKIEVPIPELTETALETLAALFSATPWGAQLPALTFGHLGVQPHMVHTLLGDTMWVQCWGERHGRVNGMNFVPYKMVNVLRWITDQAQPHLEDASKQRGIERFSAIAKAAKDRREGGSPY